MPTEAIAPLKHRRQNVSGRITGVVAILLGAFMIYLAVPRIMAYGIVARWSEAVPASLGSGIPLPPEMLEAARGDYKRATTWMPDDAALEEAYARLTLLRIEQQPEDSQALLVEAETALRAALAAAPDRAFPWALYARVRQREGNIDYIEALRLSNATGPYEAAAMLARIDVIARAFPSMPDDLRAVARRDITRLWAEGSMHAPLVHAYLKLDVPGRIVIHDVIGTDPADLRRFNALVLHAVGSDRHGRRPR